MIRYHPHPADALRDATFDCVGGVLRILVLDVVRWVYDPLFVRRDCAMLWIRARSGLDLRR